MKAKGSFNVDMGMPDEAGIQSTKMTVKEPVETKKTEEALADSKILDTEIVELQKYLGIALSEDELWQILFGNTLEKRNICIVPHKMYATFRTISMGDSNFIERQLGEIADSKLLKRGFDNINTQYLLAAGMLELGKPGNARSIGATIDERFKAIDGMSAFTVDLLSRKWTAYMNLVDKSLKRESYKGNS